MRSFFELLLFFGKDEFYEDPLKDILGSIQECQNLLNRYGNVNLELVTRIIRDGGPWEDPVLQAILKAKPVSQELVNRYLSSENPLFFELRVRYLIACERIPEAMSLIKSCMNHPEISKKLYFHQAFFMCLSVSSLEDQLFQEHLLKTDCMNGVEIICNIAKEGKTALALYLCESFLIPHLQKGDMYFIWELIFIWSKLQLKSNPSKQVFVDQCYHLLRIATNIRVIFPFMKVIKDEVGKDGLQICVEICGSALQLDLRDDPKVKCLIYKTIAHFLPNDLEIVRICALSIFFLECTFESYYTVEHLYKHEDEEYNEQISSVQNRVRFELLPILKKGLFFDPEFWNFLMIKQNCLALLKDKASVDSNETTLEHSSTSKQKLPRRGLRSDHSCLADVSNGEVGHEDLSGAQSICHGNSRKNHIALGSPKIDHNVPRHLCVLCNREFLGGHIVRHAQAHQKKGSFSCVMCRRKFRQKGVMLKHLKNHIKKMTRHQLAFPCHDQKSSDVNEVNSSGADVPLENGNLENSKDNKMEVIVLSTDQEPQNAELPLAVTENHVSNQDAIIENGSCDSHSNNTPEPETTEGLPESDATLSKEFPILHRINGIVCSQNDLNIMDQAGNFRFKLSTELAEHTKSHSEFKAQCNFAECCELFEDLSLLFEHEAQHYSHKTDQSEEVDENNSSDIVLESQSSTREKAMSSNEKEATVDLPVPTWKSRKDSTEPKTYIQSEKKINSLTQNGNEQACDDTATVVNLIDQKIPVIEPNSEDCKDSSQLVNGHSELEQAPSDTALEKVIDNTRTENGSILPVLQNCNDILPNSIATVSQSPSKPNQITENTSYGLILTKPYVRPLPPSYLDERYISMPKRRKTLTDKVDAHVEQDKTCSKSERLRCSKCLTTYCNSEALQLHLAQKKCQTLFGFDSDDESA
ncbi:UNVERIFIED_CONTAM: hypothetical protein K2H54_060602 [Gekko kuhli]